MHWLAGQIAGIHLLAVAGGLGIGAAAVLLYQAIGRSAGVSGIVFAGFREGGLRRWLFLGGIAVGAGQQRSCFLRRTSSAAQIPGSWS